MLLHHLSSTLPIRRGGVRGWRGARLMVGTVGSDQNDSARHREARPTARAMNPETNLSFSEPDTVKILLIISFDAVCVCRTS